MQKNFRLTDIGGIKYIRAHYNHLETMGIPSAILAYDVPQKNYETGEIQVVRKYCVWRMGEEAVGSDAFANSEALHNFSFSGTMYINPRIVKECHNFGGLVGLQEYVE
jgi:hypothetical protein